MTIDIVDFPIKHGDFPVRYVSHNQRVAALCSGELLGSPRPRHGKAKPISKSGGCFCVAESLRCEIDRTNIGKA